MVSNLGLPGPTLWAHKKVDFPVGGQRRIPALPCSPSILSGTIMKPVLVIYINRDEEVVHTLEFLRKDLFLDSETLSPIRWTWEHDAEMT